MQAMTHKQNPKFQDLVAKLREIFQINRPELDFGIYRIINARAGEINDYLENRLPEKVYQALASGTEAQREQLVRELKEKEAQYRADGIDPDAVPRVQELRQQLARYDTGTSEHENAVFSHLLTFFSRYYKDGDFISQRRLKGDTYVIPYGGEEVMLHWANKDQYYTKSGENFSNYSFKLEDGRTVHFRLVAADTAKDNRKDNDKERRFVLAEHKVVTRIDDQGDEYEEEILPVEEVTTADGGKELIIRFEYAAQPKGTKQEALVTKAVEAILDDAAVKARWLALGNRAPTEKNPQRTLLEKHLTTYTTKNTADYFIHKDLGGFLRRELDFYIKNEVMHLDDVQSAGAFADIEKNLRMIQCLRSIALDLITFLAQLEDFQKKLWLKKKFVVSSHYCITLDRVPEELWPEVAANEKQWDQWKNLGVWDGDAPGTIEDLKAAPYRMVDTSLFPSSFKENLLLGMDNLDSTIDGILVHGDNFPVTSLLSISFKGAFKHIYIDPPYNTGGDGFLYKDSYRHSSWMTMIHNRVARMIPLLRKDGIFSSSIDRDENRNYLPLLFTLFGEENFLEEVVWKKSYGGGSKTKHINNLHEYIHQFAASKKDTPHLELPPDPEAVKYYKFSDSKIEKRGKFRLQPLNTNSNDFRKQLTYPIPTPSLDLLGTSRWAQEQAKIAELLRSEELMLCGSFEEGWRLEYKDGRPWDGYSFAPPRQWQWGWEKLRDALINDEIVITLTNGEYAVNYKQYRFDDSGKERGRKPSSVHIGPYTQAGTDEIRNLFGFDATKFPKPVELIEDIIGIGYTDSEAWIGDFFAGSGTTGHAVISLNRKQGGKRKYVLAEQGDYFDSVLKQRLQKVVYSAEWKDGKPTAPEAGVSHCFKVLKLESYEDTLNNLQLRRTEAQGELLGKLPQQAKDDYLLKYMLDVESRGSLLSVENFRKPFDYTLNVAVDSAGAFEPRKVDLVETFNYLIGLRVKHIDAQPQRGFVTVTGTLPSGESCLVIWRDCDMLDYDGISKLCDRLAINPKDNEFDVVYINGDHNIPTVLTQTAEEGGATRVLKLRQIEPEFLERMFSVEDI